MAASTVTLMLSMVAAATAQVDLSTWPTVRIGITLTDAKGNPLHSIAPGDVVLHEMGRIEAVTSLSTTAEPQSICILIDNSHSMEDRSAMVLRAASHFVAGLPAEDEVCVASFSWHMRLEQSLTLKHDEDIAALNRVKQTNGATAMYDAVIDMAKYMQTASAFRNRVLLIFSDGSDNASAADRGAAEQTRVQLESGGSPVVHMMRIDSPSDRNSPSQKKHDEKAVFLLTSIGGGSPYLPRNEKDLTADVDGLLQEIKARAVLSYVTDNPDRDGRERTLEVKPSTSNGGARITVYAPVGYYAPSH